MRTTAARAEACFCAWEPLLSSADGAEWSQGLEPPHSCASRGPRAAPHGGTPHARLFSRAMCTSSWSALPGPGTQAVLLHMRPFFPSSPLLVLSRKEEILILSTFFHPFLNLALHKPPYYNSHKTLSKGNRHLHPHPVTCRPHFTDGQLRLREVRDRPSSAASRR